MAIDTSALSREEKVALFCELGEELLNYPFDKPVFNLLIKRIMTVPLELGVLDEEGRILLRWRRDDEYPDGGYHMPGTVVIGEWDTIEAGFARLVEKELGGTKVGPLIDMGWKAVPKGNGPGMNPTRNETSLVHVVRILEPYQGDGEFFTFTEALSRKLLPHHYALVEHIRARLHML